MVMEGNEVVANGWPLGLGNMSIRIRVADTTRRAAAPPRPHPSRILRSSSFSSFSSSNLDTESTASFFQDQSVPLGRLIGIRPPNRGSSLYCEQHRKLPNERSHSGVPKNSQGLCAPLIHHVIGKMSRSGSSSSRR